jgi:hypothetical protein
MISEARNLIGVGKQLRFRGFELRLVGLRRS